MRLQFLSIFLFVVQRRIVHCWKQLVIIPLVINSGFLPSREQLPTLTIPVSISKLHPLPEEELTTSFSVGNSLLILGRFQEALTEFDKAVEVAPENGEVLLSRGIANEKLFRWQDAIDDYKRANRLLKKNIFYRDDATVFSNLANAETGLGMWKEALQDFSYASTLKADYEAPKLGKNLVLFQLGQKQEAITYFNELAIKYPLFADGRAALAVMLYDIGDAATARDSWTVAISQDSRYLDIAWVRDFRRWPPNLVIALERYLEEQKQDGTS